jgi:hypothetical protein
MRPTRRKVLQTLGASAAGAALGSLVPPVVHGAAATGAAGRAMPFELAAVRLLPGPFRTAQELDARYLLTLEPDRMLHNFRVNAGLPPRAPVYGGWESQEPWIDIRCHGHTLGHYLGACAMMFAATGETAFRQRIDYIVAELRACQEAAGSGLICAFPDGAAPLENSLAGKPFAGVPWYTQHKIFAGLRDAHVHAAHDAALVVLKRLADWTADAVREVPDDRVQKMLDREHGGMAEVLADVHVLTGDARYLALAERFVHRALLDPLTAGRDTLDGLHSNTQIPKVIGFSRLHDLTGKVSYGEAAGFFWKTVVEARSFATGGNGDGEHFFPPAEFARHMNSAKTMETCCAHNMLRLTRALYERAPAVGYADYHERTLYNSILASQDPESGMFTYFQATRPGYVKLYCTPTDSFWCCTGSGMENHAKYGDSIYFHDAESLYVNLFIASRLSWTGRHLQITQTTGFPDEDITRLNFAASAPTRLKLRIRHPGWCNKVTVTINGRQRIVGAVPGRHVEIERTWRDGDAVEVHLPMQLRFEPLPNAPEFVAAMYGPVVLAGRLGYEGLAPGADIIVNERKSGEMLNLPMGTPQLRADAVISRVAGPRLSFRVRASQPDRDIELVPWHRIAHERYTLYWNLSSLPAAAGAGKG